MHFSCIAHEVFGPEVDKRGRHKYANLLRICAAELASCLMTKEEYSSGLSYAEKFALEESNFHGASDAVDAFRNPGTYADTIHICLVATLIKTDIWVYADTPKVV